MAPDDGIPAAQDTNKAGLFDFGGGRQGTVYFFFKNTKETINTNKLGRCQGRKMVLREAHGTATLQ